MADGNSAFSASSWELRDAAAAASEPSPLSLAPPLAAARLPVARLKRKNADPRRGVWAARETVAAYANLRDNWDECGARAPDNQDIDNALAVIDFLADEAVTSPHPCAVADGEIALEWQFANDGYLDVFLQDGELAFIFCSPAGEEKNGECAFADERAKDALLGEIRQLMRVHAGAQR